VQNTYNRLRALKVLKHSLDVSRIANTTLVPKLVAP
jgi:hypothetical protein